MPGAVAAWTAAQGEERLKGAALPEASGLLLALKTLPLKLGPGAGLGAAAGAGALRGAGVGTAGPLCFDKVAHLPVDKVPALGGGTGPRTGFGAGGQLAADAFFPLDVPVRLAQLEVPGDGRLVGTGLVPGRAVLGVVELVGFGGAELDLDDVAAAE